MVVGDFNFPFLKFQEDGNFVDQKCNKCIGEYICSHTSSEKRQAQMLLDFSNEFFMDQYIRKPTRNRNILDLCFTNDHFLIHNYQTIVNSKLSDHFTIRINLNYENVTKPTSKKKVNHSQTKIPEYDLRGGDEEDWMRLNLLLDKVDWSNVMKNLSPEDSLSEFLNILERNVSQVFKKHKDFEEEKVIHPEGRFRSGNKIPRNIRNMMRNKAKISKSILRTKSVKKFLALKDKLEMIEANLQKSYQDRRSKQENKAIGNMKKDPRSFFSYAKRFSKTNSEVGPFFNKDGDPILESEAIVDMLRNQYESVFSSPKKEYQIDDPANFFSENNADTQLDNIIFDWKDIVEVIDNLSANAAAGPDGVPAILLKKCKHSIKDGLEEMFKIFLRDGNLPKLLKQAMVIPVHKGGSRGLPANFRPVSLTSHIMKTFERIIRKILVCHLEINNKLNPNQHGFRSRRSCLSQLLEHQDRILSILEEGHNIDSIYLDFSKAFDKVDPGILCHKLRELGISGKLGILLHNFLSDREQVILANGVKSNTSKVRSGVPQGTVLGPVLFLVLINDIDESLNSSSSFVSIFADDTRISKEVQSESDVETLQKDLEQLYDWQKKNNMEFNSKKFEVLRYGKDEDLKQSTCYFTPNLDDIIDEKESLRDLGIMMSNDASFSIHVESVCSKVKQKSAWILRTFNCRKSWFLKFMWKTLVQGHVDYCSQLYFPYKQSDMEKIENLQKIYTRKFPEMKNEDYWQRLKSLKMFSQERRMERYRCIYLWKIMEGLVPNCGIEETTSDRRGREARVPQIKSSGKIQAIREASFQVNAPRLFNSLPQNIRNLSKISVDEFKIKLDKYLELLPDEPKIGGYYPSACNQFSGNPSNSIIDQGRFLRARRPGF